ncbi:MAG: ATP-grasp fold amidoligase family protein [Armatimonadota bacterium]
MQTPWATCVSQLRGWCYMGSRLAEYQFRRFAARHGYYEHLFRRRYGRAPDYASPRTFSDKLAWMRLHDRNPLYTQLVDKIAVRDYVRERVGEDVLVPLYGAWESAAEVSFDALPERFVLKCNHECGFVVLCRDRAKLDVPYVRMQLATRLRMNYYHRFLEWPYRDVPPRILAEELLQDEDGGEPVDYKFQCFHGVPQYIFAMKNRHSAPVCGFYSPEWELFPFTYSHFPLPTEPWPRPALFDHMRAIAVELSRGLPCCRVDLYAVRERVYFSELTIIAAAGFLMFQPDSYDRFWGDRLTLLPGRLGTTMQDSPGDR